MQIISLDRDNYFKNFSKLQEYFNKLLLKIIIPPVLEIARRDTTNISFRIDNLDEYENIKFERKIKNQAGDQFRQCQFKISNNQNIDVIELSPNTTYIFRMSGVSSKTNMPTYWSNEIEADTRKSTFNIFLRFTEKI